MGIIMAHFGQFYYPDDECDKMAPKVYHQKCVSRSDRWDREMVDSHWPRSKIKRMSNGNNHFMAFKETAVVSLSLNFAGNHFLRR